MHKKAIALVLALVFFIIIALVGLPFMTEKIKHQSQDKAIYVTASPDPSPDEYSDY